MLNLGVVNTERLSTKEAAKFLGVSVPTLRRWTKAGLPAIRKGQRWIRYDVADLDQWLANHKAGSSGSPPGPNRTPSVSGPRPNAAKLSSAQAKATLAALRKGQQRSTPKRSAGSEGLVGGGHA